MAMREEQLPSLHEFLDQEQGINSEGFRVTNEEQADWALRKLRKIEEQRQKDIAMAQAEIDRVEAWLEKVQEKANRDRDYFQGLLAEYAFKKRQEDPKFKSLQLPNGRIRFRKQQPAFNYDEDKMVAWLKEQGKTDLIKVKESPDKTAIKKQFVLKCSQLYDPETGEAIKGVTVEERDDKFEWGVE